MWPILLDMTEEESIQNLRHLELEAYSSLVSALRAQGSLSQEKRKLLQETGTILNIPNDRHKAEIRRAISDERLNTIAYHITGQLASLEDWAQEGRRLVPLLPRVPPQTPYSVLADEASDIAIQFNKQLPLPSNTESKRPVMAQSVAPTVSAMESVGKPQTFRIPEVPKDENKKRKGQLSGESSSLAQHLLGNKLSRIQQIYRQTSKSQKQKKKEINNGSETENVDLVKSNLGQFSHAKVQHNATMPSNSNGPKINIIQNITIPTSHEEPVVLEEDEDDLHSNELSYASLLTNKNQAPNPKSLNIKSSGGFQSDVDAVTKLGPTKKTINKGQKLIVVPNTQNITTSSILQKTLSVPMNKLTKLNLEKFKIVPNNQLSSTLQVTSVINTQNVTSPKHKVVTLKSTPGKKIIPLSQLQMLNSKGGLKVVPYNGKVFEKNMTLANTQSENSPKTAPGTPETITQTTNCCTDVIQAETELNGATTYRPGGREKGMEDFEMKIDEFQITQVNYNDAESRTDETLSKESCEGNDEASDQDTNTTPNLMETDLSAFTEADINDTALENLLQ